MEKIKETYKVEGVQNFGEFEIDLIDKTIKISYCNFGQWYFLTFTREEFEDFIRGLVKILEEISKEKKTALNRQ